MNTVKPVEQITQDISQLDISTQQAIVDLIEELKENNNHAQNHLYLVALPKAHPSTEPLPKLGNDPQGLKSLIDNLLSSEFLAQLEKDDPLLEAKLKGVQHKLELLNYQGKKALTSSEVAAVLGISRQAVDNRRKNNSLLGLSLGSRGYRYPAWQFTNGSVLRGWSEVLSNMEHLDDWSKLIFMLTGDIRLDNKIPLECLRNAQINEVVLAARAYGLQYPA
ncbi:MAG: hypothetical protein RLZZ535_1973 [Cyanobacteriota bacterium]|jgi:hypothetical protein